MKNYFTFNYKIATSLTFILSVAKHLHFVESSSIAISEANATTLSSDNLKYAEDDSILAQYNMFGGGNPIITPDGLKIVEGDIVTPTESVYTYRKATPESGVYWPNGEVIYTYHESITQPEMNIIEAAMQHWRQHTCLTFRPRQPQDYLYVRFRSDTPGCWSLVGRQMDRVGQGQDVSIGQGCANLNVVVHEIGHVIGFYHEQSRSDRDQFINIVWDNVLPGYSLQFRKESDLNQGVPYDYTSTMQYPQWAFSKELFEKSTIVALDPAHQRFLSKNYPLSFRDRKLANIIYSCSASCSNYGSTQCQNGGYLKPTQQIGQVCSCECPPNTQGSQCETVLRADYYDPLPCGGLVQEEGRIQTPNFPQRLAPYESCMWDIRAPSPSQTVSIKFEGFEFAPRFTKAGTKVINKCFNETIEIRLKNSDIYNGDIYCGNDIAPGTILKSDGPRAVIIITANNRMVGQGLRAKVKFGKPGDITSEIDDDNETNDITPVKSIPTTKRPSIITMPPVTIVPTDDPRTILPFTFPPINIVPTTRPQPGIVTISSLLEEYEKESKKTLPPIMPPY